MKRIKRLLAAALAAVLLCAALAMPSRAAGETLRYLLSPARLLWAGGSGSH
jgi:ABC-type sugar transport system substrate-binding protein